MIIDIENIQRPDLRFQVADAVFGLRKRGVNNLDIATYCIMGQETPMCSTVDDDYATVQTMPAPDKIFKGQQTSTISQHVLKLVVGKNFCFTMNENKLQCQDALFDGSFATFASVSLHRAKLYNSPHHIIAGYFGTRQMYDSLRHQFCWPHVASEVYS